MKYRLQRALTAALVTLGLAVPASAQVTNFSADVNTAIDNGINYLATVNVSGWDWNAGVQTNGNYFTPGVAGDATGLVTLVLLEKRASADQNASGVGYAGSTAADKARIDGLVQYMIDHSPDFFYSYRNGQEMMALSLYLRTGGPLAGARAALDTAFDETVNTIPGGPNQSAADLATNWHGYWCYSDAGCPDASTTQFVLSGMAAARGVYSDAGTGDPARLAILDRVATRSADAYAANGTGGDCNAGALTPGEKGHAYQAPGHGFCNSFQQTGSGTWIQLVGGANLNSPGVQSYLEWIRNRYRFTDVYGDPWWGNQSYGYGLWSTSKALSFLDDSGAVPNPGNLTTASLGLLAAVDPPAFGARQVHLDPATAARPALFGPEGANYYADPRELPRWYFDFAHTVISRQDSTGLFNSNSGWQQPSEQAYHILLLQRSVGGGCLDADGDGACDADDNCPQDANADQADGDSDGLGDSCDACPTDASNDADGDGVCGAVDNCPDVSNANQANADGDGLGDSCDTCPNDAGNDADGDSWCGDVDNCPNVANGNQQDSDSDGLGDACDACPTDASNDADGDGFCGAVDNCPNVANANQVDSDADGLGDACDACALDAANDADGDGVCGNVDNCAAANPDQTDSDRDGRGDACDACALDANNDADADGVCGNVDNCPAAANANQADTDGDGIGDVCDTINPPSCDDGSSDDHNPKHKHVHGKGHSSHGKGKGKGHDGKSCDDGSSDDHSSDGKSGKSRDKSDDKSGKSGKGGKSVKPAPKPAPAPPPAPKPAPKKK